MVKIIDIEEVGEKESYDIWNHSSCLNNEGNFIIDGMIVHNSILANGVKSFSDLLFYNAAGHPGPMQCCWSHSNIDTDCGTVEIKKLNPEKHAIAARAGNNIVHTHDYQVIYSGRKKLLKICLINGKEIIVSPDHKVATENGFICAKDLSVGQNVVVHKQS